jgi:pimeloyl-ACP methyl ester carboxylesterase
MRFVLVHGGFHGAWCWDLLIPELERRGHQAVALDLPGHGKRAHEEATLAGYRDAVVERLEPGDVLLGHSLGGFIVSVAADAAVDRVRHVVYLAAGLPVEGASMHASGSAGALGDSRTIEVSEDGQRATWRSVEAAIDFFYHDCPRELAEWAYGLLTPQPLAPLLEPISIPRYWKANLPRSLVLCRQDHAGGGPASVERNTRRLGVEPLWMDTSHSPFLSRPAECAEVILEATARPTVGPLVPTS